MHLPPKTVRETTASELPKGMEKGLIADVPLTKPPLYLPYLFDQFLNQGGGFELRTFSSLEELASLDTLVVNCTGLGAKTLCQYEDFRPMQGQILQAKKLNIHSFADPTKKESSPTSLTGVKIPSLEAQTMTATGMSPKIPGILS